MQTAQVNININAQGANKTVNDLNQNIQKAGGSAASLKTELRQVTQELQGLTPGSAKFQELSQRAGELRDRIADTSAVIQATAGNAVENLGKALGNTIQLGVAGFQALSSAQVLFGVENKDLQKTLAQMGALLNLSQAIQSFGGLSDKLTEIKAGFTPLLQQLGIMATTQTEVAVATGAADAALVGEAVAADGAAVSTGAFAATLNALPLVAIVTALGLLVAGLISYSSASSEAEIEEKKRKKSLEDLEKQTKKNNEETKTHQEFILAETSAFIGLALQLQGSNKGTKERTKLIKEINSTYGTTLKNLSDETLFQNQINKSIENYLILAEAKYKLAQNQGKIDKLIAQKVKLEEAQAAFAQVGFEQTYDNFLKLGEITKRYGVTSFEAAVKIQEVNSQLKNLTKSSFELGSSVNSLSTGFNTNTNSVKNNSDALNDYESILNKIRSNQEENKKQEDELYKKRSEAFDKTINLIEVEQKTREEAAIKEYEAVRLAITKELTAKKISKEEKKRLNELEKLNEENLTKSLSIENERRLLNIQLTTLKILDDNRKRIEYLKEEEKALQNEIRFGDGNTTDTKIDLLQRQNTAFIQNIDMRLSRSKYSNQIELVQFEDLQKQKLELLKDNLNQENLNKKQIAESDFARQLDLEKTRIEGLNDLSVQITKDAKGVSTAVVEIKDKEIKAISEMDNQARLDKLESLKQISVDLQKQIDKEKDIKKKAALEIQKNDADAALTTFSNNILLADDLAGIRVKTEENLNTTIINLDEDKNVKILEADATLNSDIKAQTIKTEEEILDEKIKRLDEYLAFAQQQFQSAASLISQFAKQQQDIRTQQLADSIANDRTRIETAYADQLISRAEYDNQIAQLDQKQQQKQLAIDRKNFKTEKALNLVGATVDGARAVLGTFAGTPGGIVIKTIAATLAGIFAATQIALIARQEFKAASGGIVPGNGSGEIDTVPSRLAPGESVINSQSTQAFLPLLSAINEIGGGKSFVPDLPPTNAPQKFAPVFMDKQEKEPIRAYVVESDISSAQRRVSRIERSTRF